MSDVFEAVVVFANEAAISRSFAELRSHLALRLTRLAPSILGVYRSEYPNGRPFDVPEREPSLSQGWVRPSNRICG